MKHCAQMFILDLFVISERLETNKIGDRYLYEWTFLNYIWLLLIYKSTSLPPYLFAVVLQLSAHLLVPKTSSST